MQAIINRSLSEYRTAAEAKQVITGRLTALARTHAILAETAWEGAPLDEILKRELSGFANSVHVTGCDIVANAAAAHQFALIFHELATNALKYGALSVPGGRISVTAEVTQAKGAPQFSLLWNESGGPPITEPARKGFGSVILFETAKQFGMEVTVTYDPGGLKYALRVPLQDIVPSKAPANGGAADTASADEGPELVTPAGDETAIAGLRAFAGEKA